MRARRLPAREDIVLAEALARELSGTESGAQLADLVALGHLADGEPGHAANALLQPRGGRDTAWEEALASAAAASIAALSDIDLFGLAIQERGPDLLVLLSDRQRIYVSMRLTDLGFPTLASEMLGGIDADGQEARRALARAALATQDPAKALALVAGDDTPASAMLRGDALSALGEHARAAMAYADAQDADRAARAAWLSGQREAILRHGTDRQRATASALLQGESVRSPAPSRPQGTAGGDSPSSPPPAQETTPSLSGARALAAESASLRDTLEQVLSDRPSSAP
jgi:hypothetical protein